MLLLNVITAGFIQWHSLFTRLTLDLKWTRMQFIVILCVSIIEIVTVCPCKQLKVHGNVSSCVSSGQEKKYTG